MREHGEDRAGGAGASCRGAGGCRRGCPEPPGAGARVWDAPPNPPQDGLPPRGVVGGLGSGGEGGEEFLPPTSSAEPLGRSPQPPPLHVGGQLEPGRSGQVLQAKLAAPRKFLGENRPVSAAFCSPPGKGGLGKLSPRPAQADAGGQTCRGAAGADKNPVPATPKPSTWGAEKKKARSSFPRKIGGDFFNYYFFLCAEFGLCFTREGMSEIKLLGTRSRRGPPPTAAQTRREHPRAAGFGVFWGVLVLFFFQAHGESGRRGGSRPRPPARGEFAWACRGLGAGPPSCPPPPLPLHVSPALGGAGGGIYSSF